MVLSWIIIDPHFHEDHGSPAPDSAQGTKRVTLCAGEHCPNELCQAGAESTALGSLFQCPPTLWSKHNLCYVLGCLLESCGFTSYCYSTTMVKEHILELETLQASMYVCECNSSKSGWPQKNFFCCFFTKIKDGSVTDLKLCSHLPVHKNLNPKES